MCVTLNFEREITHCFGAKKDITNKTISLLFFFQFLLLSSKTFEKRRVVERLEQMLPLKFIQLNNRFEFFISIISTNRK